MRETRKAYKPLKIKIKDSVRNSCRNTKTCIAKVGLDHGVAGMCMSYLFIYIRPYGHFGSHLVDHHIYLERLKRDFFRTCFEFLSNCFQALDNEVL